MYIFIDIYTYFFCLYEGLVLRDPSSRPVTSLRNGSNKRSLHNRSSTAVLNGCPQWQKWAL